MAFIERTGQRSNHRGFGWLENCNVVSHMLSLRRQVVKSDPRRGKIRYPIRMNLRYSLFRMKRLLKAGAGTTVNISSSGILFEAEESLPPGYIVHLAVGWPRTIDDRVGLVLRIIGRTIRTQGRCTAAVILNREFHVRSLRTHMEEPACAAASPSAA